MPTYVALLRAVNLGGTNKLPMADLKRLCEAAGFRGARTYIASGNVLFASDLAEPEVKAALEARLRAYAGKPVPVLVRTAAELRRVVADNPFSGDPPDRTVAVFLDAPPPADALARATGVAGEALGTGAREVYIAYRTREGMRDSKLKLPALAHGTARNMNTVAALARMAAGDSPGG